MLYTLTIIQPSGIVTQLHHLSAVDAISIRESFAGSTVYIRRTQCDENNNCI